MPGFYRYIIILLVLQSSLRLLAQSTVVAKPVSDERGMIAFQITEIINVEGDWSPPLTIGELLYPQKRQKAHPIMRFGEAIIIALTEPGNRKQWQGLHVHNGCIPALQGKPLVDMIKDVEQQAKDRALAQVNAPPPKGKAPSPTGPELFGICPICHQRHIRIR